MPQSVTVTDGVQTAMVPDTNPATQARNVKSLNAVREAVTKAQEKQQAQHHDAHLKMSRSYNSLSRAA